MNSKKAFPTIGCCGLDCGLCPRFNSTSKSKCPGCFGPNFSQKHPSCLHTTCCVIKKGLEVCSECKDYPCSKFNGWDKSDSFTSHLKSLENLNFIKENGIEIFIKQQKKRMEILEYMLKHYNEGRSRSFFCVAATLLEISDLEKVIELIDDEILKEKIKSDDIKVKSKISKSILNQIAKEKGIVLKLRKK